MLLAARVPPRGGSLAEAYLDRNCFDLAAGVPPELKRVPVFIVTRQRAPPAPRAAAAAGAGAAVNAGVEERKDDAVA